MKIWKLRNGMPRAERKAHPWLYSGELRGPTNSVEPGEPVEVVDEDGAFFARGYAHPKSKIAVRIMTRNPELEPFAPQLIQFKLKKALESRRALLPFSFRLLFAEGDEFPGLIIDRFLTPDREKQIFVFQCTTAGADRHFETILQVFESFVNERSAAGDWPNWQNTGLIISNTSTSRVREGLELQEREVIKDVGLELSPMEFLVEHFQGESLKLRADLLKGQKTGFFFDQRRNILMTLEHLARNLRTRTEGETFSVLDLCCYVGQWSAHLARFLNDRGFNCRLTLIDGSQVALQLAETNLQGLTNEVTSIKGDVLRDLNRVGGPFDIVICDPPAFIKKKVDVRAGIAAYSKLNTQALKLTKSGGLYVTCSCSALLTADDWDEMIQDASKKSARMVQWLARGGHALDHPVRPEFPEGEYLKARLANIK